MCLNFPVRPSGSCYLESIIQGALNIYASSNYLIDRRLEFLYSQLSGRELTQSKPFGGNKMKGMDKLADFLLDMKFRQHQRNAFNQGKEWTLTFDQYVKAWGTGICPYEKVQMTFEPNCPNTASIERVDNTKGYIAGNVVFVCWKANRAKNNMTLRQFQGMCKRVVTR